MKVLMFGWEFPPVVTGGLGTACHGLSLELSKLDVAIDFVLPKNPDAHQFSFVNLLSSSNVPIDKTATLQFKDSKLNFLSVDSPLRPYETEESYLEMQKMSSDKQEVKTVERSVMQISGGYGDNLIEEVSRYALVAGEIVGQKNYDIIHAHDWMTFMAGVHAKQKSALPLVIHVHATEFDRSGENINQQVYAIEKLGMQEADRIIAVSERTKSVIVEKYGIPASKVTVAYNGVKELQLADSAKYDHRLPEKIVTFLGRVTMQKGPEYFVEAAYLVSQKLKNVRFVMAGTGDKLPAMIDKIASMRLTDRFHFTGFLNEEKRNQLFQMSDVFVLSSVSEPFGITPLEALQHDVPVILTKQSGVAEVVPNSLQVDFWDVRKMAEAMIKILTEEGLSKQLRTAGAADVAQLTWGQCAHKVKEVYRETMA